jgi:hypothetical protein
MTFLRLYLWLTPNLLLGVCLFLLLRRGLHRQYPILTSYILLQLLLFFISVLLTPAFFGFSSLSMYQWTVAISTGVIAAAEIGVLYEVTNELVLSHLSAGRMVRSLLRTTAAISLLIAAVACALLSVSQMNAVFAAFQALDFSTNVINVSLLLVLILFTRALHISWRSLPAGIALGLAVSGCKEIAAAALLSKLDASHYVRIDVLRMAGFHLWVVIWLLYIWFAERRPIMDRHNIRVSDLESWNDELQRVVRP